MDNFKTCTICKTNKDAKDFLLNKDECYKCIYIRKKFEMRKLPKTRLCRECSGQIPQRRWTYCSYACGKKGKAKSDDNYWTEKLKGYWGQQRRKPPKKKNHPST